MKFCYNNSNLARQVPRNDRHWWYIAALLTVFLLFKLNNMAITDILKTILGAPNQWQQDVYNNAVNQQAETDWNKNVYVNSPTFQSPITQQQLDNSAKTISIEQYQPGWTNGQTPVVSTNPEPAPQGDNNADLIAKYKASGWTDINAILADIAAGGGSKFSSGGGQSLNDYMRGQIEGGYNDYFSKLNDLYGGLNTQGQAQENIAQNSYNQSIKDLLANKQSSLGDIGLSEQKLQANQVKNLRDIGSNIQNQYMAGNVMLGARGAGDSSAANQYSYALNRIGSKERGNVMNQTAQSQAELENQKAKLNNIVTQETSRLDTELANTKQSISSWLAEQQNAIKEMIAEGIIKKRQDITSATTNALNTALSLYQTKASEIQNRRSQLETWAMNNSTNINQLIPKLQEIGAMVPNMPTANAINGGVQVDSQGNLRSLFGYGTSDEDKLNY